MSEGLHMTQIVIAYIAALVAVAALDFLWFGFASDRIFRPALDPILTDNPKLAIGAIFYLLYPAALVYFAVIPALGQSSLNLAILNGALIGLLVYGTYDVTNLTLLKLWPLKIAVIDILWGTAMTAMSACLSYVSASLFR